MSRFRRDRNLRRKETVQEVGGGGTGREAATGSQKYGGKVRNTETGTGIEGVGTRAQLFEAGLS